VLKNKFTKKLIFGVAKQLNFANFLRNFVVTGGALCKAEIASGDKMSLLSENPSDDLPNEEKNQH